MPSLSFGEGCQRDPYQESKAFIACRASKHVADEKVVPLRKAKDRHPNKNGHDVLREQFPDSHYAKDDPKEVKSLFHLGSFSVKCFDQCAQR